MMTIREINQRISKLPDRGQVSDGYHTFDELYAVRCLLFVVLIQTGKYPAWKAKANDDGQKWEGWFVAGINPEPGQQITFHLPIKYWDRLPVNEYDVNPYYDGHNSADVAMRLERLT